jgi:hypothetical protein
MIGTPAGVGVNCERDDSLVAARGSSTLVPTAFLRLSVASGTQRNEANDISNDDDFSGPKDESSEDLARTV